MTALFAEIRLDRAPVEDLSPLFRASAEPPGDGDSVRSWEWAALGCRAFWSTPEEIGERQPFVDPAGRFAFSHNGELGRWQGARAAYREQGRISGRADSEVGQRWLEDAWEQAAPAELLARLHAGFGGVANLAVIERDGRTTQYAGNPENPVFTFRLGPIGLASTAVYSIDRSLFRFAAPGATARRLARLNTTIVLDECGEPRPARRGEPMAQAIPGT